MRVITFFVLSLFTAGCLNTGGSFVTNSSSPVQFDKNNYYEFYLHKPDNNALFTEWLVKDEILSVIFSEFEKAGLQVERNIEIQKGNTFYIVDGFCRLKNVGFMIEEGKNVPSKKKRDPEVRFLYSVELNKNNDYVLVPAGSLPGNIFLFKQEWYWFQGARTKSEVPLVGKENIIEILRKDVRDYLKPLF